MCVCVYVCVWSVHCDAFASPHFEDAALCQFHDLGRDCRVFHVPGKMTGEECEHAFFCRSNTHPQATRASHAPHAHQGRDKTSKVYLLGLLQEGRMADQGRQRGRMADQGRGKTYICADAGSLCICWRICNAAGKMVSALRGRRIATSPH